MPRKNHIQTAALLLSAFALGGQALAHSGAMGIVKERMDSMATLGDHAKAVGDMLKGKTAFEVSVVEEAAEVFVSHGERMPLLFPDTVASREGAKTEALPAIWDNWEDFTALASKFTQDSQTLVAVINGLSTEAQSTGEQSRAVRAAFFRASKNCSGCHERFRLDQD